MKEVLAIFVFQLAVIGTLMFFGVKAIISLATWAVEPDTRTVEEIQVDEYKKCIKRLSQNDVLTCKNYLN